MFTSARLDFIRHALDGAVDRWQDDELLPRTDLLRDGLLLLEQGETLDDNQRILLLRSALEHGKGVITALRHQNDPERVAVVLCEALLRPQATWTPADLQNWLQALPQFLSWREPLRDELLAAQRTALLGQRSRIVTLLAVLRGAKPVGAKSIEAEVLDRWVLVPEVLEPEIQQAGQDWQQEADPTLVAPGSSRLRTIMAIVLLSALLIYFGVRFGPGLWALWAVQRDEVPITAWLPPLDVVAGGPTDLVLRRIIMNRHEVTNGQYRYCVSAGQCPVLANRDSTTRTNYLGRQRYANYPVVNVNWDAAAAYCHWIGQRLPSVEEWQTAASYAPATGRLYTFPWGERFEPGFVISAEAGFDDTAEVGSRRPSGSSPMGVDDMAGNVAEWTATIDDNNGVVVAVVKGGSFRDAEENLRNDAQTLVPTSEGQQWIGFRCVYDGS